MYNKYTIMFSLIHSHPYNNNYFTQINGMIMITMTFLLLVPATAWLVVAGDRDESSESIVPLTRVLVASVTGVMDSIEVLMVVCGLAEELSAVPPVPMLENVQMTWDDNRPPVLLDTINMVKLPQPSICPSLGITTNT